MRNSPGRKQRRQLARSGRKRGDLNRLSTIDRLKSVFSIFFRRKREVPND
jgi:hypothetical protein